MSTVPVKMLAGELYDSIDSELVARRVHARDLCQALNATHERDIDQRRAVRHGVSVGARAVIGAGSVDEQHGKSRADILGNR